ncbi:MAG: thiamine pyrophosphate-binding protein [bacterium]
MKRCRLRLSGNELVVKALKAGGVRHAFAVSGGQLLGVFDALADEPSIRLVVPRSEDAAITMADGCARASGTPAAVLTTVGVGPVNLPLGMAEARDSCTPVISIAPAPQNWKTDPLQENLQGCCQNDLMKPLTRWSVVIRQWERIPALLSRAFREALAEPPGPVHADVPFDVLFEKRFIEKKRFEQLFPRSKTPAASGRSTRLENPGAKIPPFRGDASTASGSRRAATLKKIHDELSANDLAVYDGVAPPGGAATRRRTPTGKTIQPFRANTGRGLPLALGAKIASPRSRVVLFTTGASLFRSVRELETARAYGLSVAIFVFAAERDGDDAARGVGFPEIAEAFGLRGTVLPSGKKGDAAIRTPLKSETASLVEIH